MEPSVSVYGLCGGFEHAIRTPIDWKQEPGVHVEPLQCYPGRTLRIQIVETVTQVSLYNPDSQQFERSKRATQFRLTTPSKNINKEICRNQNKVLLENSRQGHWLAVKITPQAKNVASSLLGH